MKKQREHLRLVPQPQAEVAAASVESITAAATDETATTATDETATTSMVAAGVVTNDWSAKVCDRFEEIGKLPPRWDGYDADSISKPTMNFALMLLGHVQDEALRLAFPSISPMSNGSIMIEWRTRTHEITVEVNNTNNVDVLVEVIASGHTDEFHIASDFAKISDLLEQSTKPVHAVA